jgi:hypothetical protein
MGQRQANHGLQRPRSHRKRFGVFFRTQFRIFRNDVLKKKKNKEKQNKQRKYFLTVDASSESAG